MSNKNKFRNFKVVDKIKRYRGIFPTRLNKIRLDANERVSEFDNKFLTGLIKKIQSHHFTAYPEVEEIYDLLAKFNKIKRENIMITAGSDIGIRHCFELFAEPKSQIITLSPTFGMYDVYSKLFNVNQLKIGYDKDLELNYTKLINSINKNTSLILLANPNSPTGTIISEDNILKLLKKAKSYKSFVVIDEAYFGFYKHSSIKYLKTFNNLIVLRTFSKAIGMAGIRTGYIISSSQNIKRLYSFRPMYEISSVSCLAIKEILKNYKLVKKYINETNKGKEFLVNQLSKIKLKSFKTYSNFILVNFNTKNKCLKVFKNLNKNGILTRKAPNIKACENSLRFTLGPKKYMQILIKEIKKSL